MIVVLEVVQAAGLGVGLLFVALLFWGLRRRPEAVSQVRPRISVLVAARNEENALPRCLESLAAQDYSRDLCEFIIIDDASTDATPRIVQSWCERDGRFRLLRLEEKALRTQGPKKRALTEGLKVSQGEIILVTDADCAPPPRWIMETVRCFTADTDVVCGAVKYLQARSRWSSLAAFDAQINAIMNAAVIGLGSALSCSGANFAYRRDAFWRAGGFDSGGRSISGDDDLLLQRMKAQGLNVRFCRIPSACVETESPDDAHRYVSRKRRHLSAGKHYAPHWILLSTLIYIGCLSTVILGIWRLMGVYRGNFFIFMWGLLSLSQLALYFRGVYYLRIRPHLLAALPIAIFFPLIFAFIQPLTLFPAPAWKGRGNRGRPHHLDSETAGEI